MRVGKKPLPLYADGHGSEPRTDSKEFSTSITTIKKIIRKKGKLDVSLLYHLASLPHVAGAQWESCYLLFIPKTIFSLEKKRLAFIPASYVTKSSRSICSRSGS